MNARVLSILGAVVLAAGSPLSVQASDAQAPPTPTPLVARDVATACPGTSGYADALARGATAEEASAAAPLFDACARSAHRDFYPLRESAANVAVGAAYLSRGVLNHDPAMLRRAIDATAALRAYVRANDETIRRWPIIPDEYDARSQEVVIRTDCAHSWGANAAYINVAAHQGSAWITTPREALPQACAVPPISFRGPGLDVIFQEPSGPRSAPGERPEARGEPVNPPKEPPR
jgi:hypothetical protein